MITRLNVATIYVLDKDEALDFYVNKLGLEVGNDFRQGDYRWLTVRVPGEHGTEISLEQPGPPLHDEATAAQIRELITKGAMGGLVFLTDDARGALRDPQGARRHRLHPGADRPLLRHRHGRPRSVRQRHPDPPAGEGRPARDRLTGGDDGHLGGGGRLIVEVKRLTKASAVSATSRQPLSIVSAWPRPGISTISVTPSLPLLLLVRGVGDRPRDGVVLLAGDDQQRTALRVRRCRPSPRSTG